MRRAHAPHEQAAEACVDQPAHHSNDGGRVRLHQRAARGDAHRARQHACSKAPVTHSVAPSVVKQHGSSNNVRQQIKPPTTLD